MYEKDGEKYFVFDSHLHFWDASPENWKPGAEEYAKGWIECFHAYMGLAPAETHWTLERFQKYSVEELREGRASHNGPRRDFGPCFQSTIPEGVEHDEAFNDIDRTPGCSSASRASCCQRPLGPARGRRRPQASSSRPPKVRHSRAVQAHTRPSGTTGSRGWKLTDP
jgi:hypothetical protein